MKQPRVHVHVINWNGLEHLEACFTSLCADPYPNALFYLLDNGSSDDSAAFVKERFGSDERVDYLILEENRGWSGANNVAIAHSLDHGADYVFLLNNDTRMEPGAIQRMVDAAEADKGVGALAPKMLLFDEPSLLNSLGLQCSTIGSSWDIGLGRSDGPQWDAPVPVIGVCGGAMFLRAEALRKSGLLPEDFEIYLDDLDLSLRIWQAGFQIWTCPEARIYHKFSATMGQSDRARHKYYLNTRNRFRLLLRNFPLLLLIQSLPDIVRGECKALGRAVLDGEAWRVRAHFRAYVDALGYIPTEIPHRRRAALTPCRFRNYIVDDPLFFPGVPLPKDGWYQEESGMRPIARNARLTVEEGKVELKVYNLFPSLGSVQLLFRQGTEVLRELNALDETLVTLDVATGTLVIEAESLFLAETTGLPYDCGGWIGSVTRNSTSG